MEKIPNIQATKEYQFAKEVENMLNNYSFNHSVFAASIPFMHPDHPTTAVPINPEMPEGHG